MITSILKTRIKICLKQKQYTSKTRLSAAQVSPSGERLGEQTDDTC